MRTIGWLLVLSGCGYDEEKFAEAYLDEYCRWGAECALYGTEQECRDEHAGWTPAGESCVYDGQAARDCVKAMEELACPTGAQVDYPNACSAVYDCGDDTDLEE